MAAITTPFTTVAEDIPSAAEVSAARAYIVAHRPDEFVHPESALVTLPQLYPQLLTALLNSPGLGDYRILACDALCVWLQRASQCRATDPVFTLPLTTADADNVFAFACEYWSDAGPALSNALRELLTKLIALLQKVASADDFAARLARWAAQLLAFPRTMRVVYFGVEILARQLGGRAILALEPRLLRDTLPLMHGNALANPAAKMLAAALTTARKSDIAALGNSPTTEQLAAAESAWLGLWEADVVAALEDEATRAHVQTYLLPALFKASAPACTALLTNLKQQPRQTETTISVLVGCLSVAQDLGIFDSGEATELLATMLSDLLRHSSEDLRIGGLRLAVSSPQASKPIPPRVLNTIAQSYDDLILEPDPEFRNRVQGLMRQMIFRIRDSCYAMVRMQKKFLKKNEDEKAELLGLVVHQNMTFLEGYLDHLQQLLRPGSSYQRMHMSLRLLSTLIRSGMDSRVASKFHEKNHLDFPFHIPIFTDATIRLLADGLMNNYEDIREMSASLLKMAPVEAVRAAPEVYAHKGIESITGLRGRDGDGGARIIEFAYHLYTQSGDSQEDVFLEAFLDKLESAIARGRENLMVAVKAYPLHGYFAALRLIFEHVTYCPTKTDYWVRLHARAIRTCFAVWELVEKVLCHDSPEGNLPEDAVDESYLASMEHIYGPATQVILSYAWRAIAESSGMLAVLLTRPSDALLMGASWTTVSDLGGLLLAELATIRHRGAFSSIYPAFVACCMRCNASEYTQLRACPNKWLRDNMQLIEDFAQLITRRSGGLPYLVAGVLAAEASTFPNGGPLLAPTLTTFFSTAARPANLAAESDKMELPQVHALNCIKTVFVETRLSAAAAAYTDRALSVAIAAFASKVWSVRNAGVMLFAALQTRLFGSRKTTADAHATVGKMSVRQFFSKFPHTQDELQRHLETYVHGNSAAVETVYPVLSLLARLQGTSGYAGLDEGFRPLILSCLASPLWKIREMAARSVVALVSGENWIAMTTELVGLIAQLAEGRGHNGAHGAVLAVDALLDAYGHTGVDAVVYANLTSAFELATSTRCEPVVLAFLRVCEAALTYPGESTERWTLQSAYVAHLRLRIMRECTAAGPDIAPGTSLLNSAFPGLYISAITRGATESLSDGLLACAKSDDPAMLLSTMSILSSPHDIPDAAQHTLGTRALHIFLHAAWPPLRAASLNACIALAVFTTNYTNTDTTTALVTVVTNALHHDEANSVGEAALVALGGISAGRNVAGVRKVWYEAMVGYTLDDSPFSKREAGLRSVCAYIKHSPAAAAVAAADDDDDDDDDDKVMYLKVLLKLHAFLDDDDSDLREYAAVFICTDVLHQHDKDDKMARTTVVAATARLAGYIVSFATRIPRARNELLEVSLRTLLDEEEDTADDGDEKDAIEARAMTYTRLIGDDDTLTTREIAKNLARADTSATALFVIEPANLHRDVLARANSAAHVLLAVLLGPPAQASTTKEQEKIEVRLSTYLGTAVRAIVAVSSTKDEEHADGVFGGWTSRDRVYQFMARTQLVAHVLTALTQASAVEQEEDKGAAYAEQLRVFLERTGAHPLLLR
ncbi:putative death-receptor fusion protein-domain-containing protein [Limtongia smithiae]|uniref:putative death-receptor fusion protein-domain-containing protein n=1 Tax=Limtongia smithiae TaxID=1125753 RepID=UPI0034CF6E8A